MLNRKPAFTPAQSALLDAIRYLLALIVVLGHGLGFYFGYFGGFFPNTLPYPQSVAVVCFFFLSGLLIATSQFGGGGTLGKYLFDRAARIYVTLIPSIIFVCVVDLIASTLGITGYILNNYFTVKHFLLNLFLIPPIPFGTMRTVWSLMYEWWIYLLFGGLFYIRQNFIIGSILVVLGAYFTIFISGRGEAGHIWNIWWMGAACAALMHYTPSILENERLVRSGTIFSAATSAAIYTYTKDAYNVPAAVLICAAMFGFINVGAAWMDRLVNFQHALRFLAGISFTLFLTHYTVMTYVIEILHLGGWLGFVVSITLSHIVAVIIAYYTELRISSIKSTISSYWPIFKVRREA